jgi:serine/threonine protein kinase
VVCLKHSFFSKGEKVDDVFLNLVMEYIPETIYRSLRNHTKARKLVPLILTKTYIYQVARALAYIHSRNICHRDIKPQNLLLDARTHHVRLCDFGSAKTLVRGEANVAYICSRYYRAPELVFEATEYTTQIDIWSLGCVLAELLLGNPLFPGDSGADQLIEIIKILGTPSDEEIMAMNPSHTPFKFPLINPHPWSKVFRQKASSEAIHLVSSFLRFSPAERLDAFDALAHPFFDELRAKDAVLPGNARIPNLFNWTEDELRRMDERGLRDILVPEHARASVQALELRYQQQRQVRSSPGHPNVRDSPRDRA